MSPNGLDAAIEGLRHLATAVATARLYSAGHQQVKHLCRRARTSLRAAMEADSSCTLMRIDEQLVVNRVPLDTSISTERLARLLKSKGVGHITINKDLQDEELRELVAALAGSQTVVYSSANLRLGQVEVRHRTRSDNKSLPRETAAREKAQHTNDGQVAVSSEMLKEISGEELARVMDIYNAVTRNSKLQIAGLSEIVGGFVNLFAEHVDPFLTLVPVRDMDEYTFVHSLNVCLLNLAQAMTLGIEGSLLQEIGLAAMLHDVGKLFIPIDILTKPEALDDDEWALMQKHPERGAKYLVNTPGVPRLAVINAYEHHMRFDLQGYPRSRNNWQQNLCSQMTSISDIYDSLSTQRPYRSPLDTDSVLDYIKRMAGTQLHPLLVTNFLQLMKKHAHAESLA